MCIPYPSPSWDGLTDLIMIVSKSWLGQGLPGKTGNEGWFFFIPKKADIAMPAEQGRKKILQDFSCDRKKIKSWLWTYESLIQIPKELEYV